MAAVLFWIRGNPWKAALVIAIIAAAIYAKQAGYYKKAAAALSVANETQRNALNNVERANEIEREVYIISDTDVHERLYERFCRDC